MILGFLLLALALLALVLQRLYSSIPSKELKRLAGRGDHLARSLHRVSAYGTSLRLLLWTVVAIALPLGYVLVASQIPVIAAFGVLAGLCVLSLIFIPSMRLTQHSARFATLFVPTLVWVLSHIHPFLVVVGDFISRFRELTAHSRLYEKEDLLGLFAQQKEQADNRISDADLELAKRALTFSDKCAADITIPRNKLLLVNADDTIGPLLLDQLHKSKQHSFLVYKDEKENIIGCLSMSTAVGAKHGGRVFDLVRNDLVFVHEDFTLRQVFDAIRQTGYQLVVVINGFEEFVGVITLDRILNALLGEPNNLVAYNYESRSNVAAYKPEATDSDVDGGSRVLSMAASDQPGSSPEPTEVVE